MKHIFSLYFPDTTRLFDAVTLKQSIVIQDKELYHRIVRILRFNKNDCFNLFDKTRCIQLCIENIDARAITSTVLNNQITHQLHPIITFGLPLLKRDALENAVYGLTSCGVNHIQLLITQKSSSSYTPKDHERIQRIMIAGAEQTQRFLMPTVEQPLQFNDWIKRLEFAAKCPIFFDPSGKNIAEILSANDHVDSNHYILIIGPEGDLTESEKNILQNHGFIFYALTQTILRADQAALLSAGLIRSFSRFK